MSLNEFIKIIGLLIAIFYKYSFINHLTVFLTPSLKSTIG